MAIYSAVEIPFNYRHTCWFCGEPSDKKIKFPEYEYEINILNHQPLTLPSCKECATIVKRSAFPSIYGYRDAIKQALVTKHQKVLAIGSKWTKRELEESELEGSAFEGFKRSAWPMFEMMQARINYQGWPLVINNELLEVDSDNEGFEFDGVQFICLDAAVTHAVNTFFLDEELFTRVLSVLGKNKFSQAIRLCRLYPNLTTKTREAVFLEILDSIGI
jgi:hypothetical protein